MSDTTTYPIMNAKITSILRVSNNPASLYAAQRIEELEAEVERLRKQNESLFATVSDECAWKENEQCRKVSKECVIENCWYHN